MISGFARASAVHFLPDDQPAVDRALVAGRTLVESGDSDLGRAVARLVDALLPLGSSPRTPQGAAGAAESSPVGTR